jgi:hypothetical protein
LTLSELTASSRRLALVGLAKNTGKTVTLAALLREHRRAGRTIGVTSVGRDGEEHDVIDFRIEKPRVELVSGSLVATTDSLLRASGIPSELLDATGIRTPLGEVLIARMKGPGPIEVAGPSAAGEVREVSDAMLAQGAEQVLIDGAIDRRAASSPEVADGLVMSTGAILSEDIDEVIERTAEAVALVRLPTADLDGPLGARLSELTGDPGGERRALLLSGDDAVELPPRFVLTAGASEVGALLGANPAADRLLVSGAVPEAFVRVLAEAARRSARPLTLTAADPTKVFLHDRGVEHYGRMGLAIETIKAIDLRALTVNPIAPQSHAFDSARLRSSLGEAIKGVEIFDVMHPSYTGEPAGMDPIPG